MRSAVQTGPRRRRRREVEDEQFLKAIRRLIRRAGRRTGQGDPHQLAQLLSLYAELDDAVVTAVRGLRQNATWDDIGRATGTTRQAAIMKWGPKLRAVS